MIRSAAQVMAFVGVWSAAALAAGQPRWVAPALDDENCTKWHAFIRPTEAELKWRKVRWHKHLSEAAAEAKELGRPILLWTMNGHPCGET